MQNIEIEPPLGALDSMIAGLQAHSDNISKTGNDFPQPSTDNVHPITDGHFWRNEIASCRVCPKAMKGEMFRMLNEILQHQDEGVELTN